MIKRYISLIAMAVIISFLGFVLENVWMSATKGYIDNRNMTFPFLLGYGIMMVGYYEVFGLPDSFNLSFLAGLLKTKRQRKIAYFIMTFFVVSIGEILLGFFTEKFFGFFYWNYERLPMHITRYTSVPTSCGFSLVITFFMDVCFTPLLEAVESVPVDILCPVSMIMLVLISYDCVKSFLLMHNTRHLNVRWVIHTGRIRDEQSVSSQIGKEAHNEG